MLPSLSRLALRNVAAVGAPPGSERGSSLSGGGGGSNRPQDTARGGTRGSSFSFGRVTIRQVPTLPRAPSRPGPTNMVRLRSDLTVLQTTVAEAEQVTFEDAQKIFTLREQLDVARASLSERVADNEAYRVALQAAQRELLEQVAQVEKGHAAALALLEAERRAGRISAEEANRIAATLQSEADAMCEERDAARELLVSASLAANATRNNLSARETELNDLRQNNEALARQLARQLAASRENNEELQRVFDVEVNRLLLAHEKLESQLTNRTQELSGCVRRCKDSDAKLAAEKARGDAIPDREIELMGELAERDSELARKDVEIKAVKKALQDCEEELVMAVSGLRGEREQHEDDADYGDEYEESRSLVAMLRYGIGTQQSKAAFSIFLNLAVHEADKVAIVSLGGIPLLVALVRDGSPKAQENAALVLAYLASDNAANKAAIVAAGGIPPFVALVRDGTTEVQTQYAARVLSNLADDNDANKAVIVSLGGIPPLVALVRDGNQQQKISAAGALASLADDNDANKAAIVAAGGGEY